MFKCLLWVQAIVLGQKYDNGSVQRFLDIINYRKSHAEVTSNSNCVCFSAWRNTLKLQMILTE